MPDSAYESGAEAFVEVMRRRYPEAIVVRKDVAIDGSPCQADERFSGFASEPASR